MGDRMDLYRSVEPDNTNVAINGSDLIFDSEYSQVPFSLEKEEVQTEPEKPGGIPDDYWKRLMLSEGGGKYHENEGDSGGGTKWGISKGAFPNEDIKNLTEERARELATENYWNKLPDEYKKDYSTFQEFFNTGRYGQSREEKIRYYVDLYRQPTTKSGTVTKNFINGWMNQAIGADNGQIFSNSKINAKDLTPDELFEIAMREAKKLNPGDFG